MRPITAISLLLLLSTTKSLAQMAVTAPHLEAMTLKNNASVVKHLEEAARQSETLKESASLLKKSADLFEKINKNIRLIADIKQITEDQIRLIREAASAINEAKKITKNDPRALTNYINKIDRTIRANRKNVELLNSVLTDRLRLSDGERLKMITDVQNNTDENLAKIQTMKIIYSNYRSVQDLVFKQ